MRIAVAVVLLLGLFMIGVADVGRREIKRGAQPRRFGYEHHFYIEYEYPCAGKRPASARYFPFDESHLTEIGTCGS